MTQTTTTVERFNNSYTPEPNTGCWFWEKYIRPDGYGMFAVDRIPRKAHRVSWELYRGPIPDGMVIDHTCRQRSCVNPEHLRVVTRKINSLENSASHAAKNAVKTHCANGHSYDGRTLTGRFCRTCHNATMKIYRFSKKNANRSRPTTVTY